MLPLLTLNSKAMCAYGTLTASPAYEIGSSTQKTSILTTAVSSLSDGHEVEYWMSSRTTTEVFNGRSVAATINQTVSISMVRSQEDAKKTRSKSIDGRKAAGIRGLDAFLRSLLRRSVLGVFVDCLVTDLLPVCSTGTSMVMHCQS